MRFQMMAPRSPARMTFGSTTAAWIIPLPSVFATAVPTVNAAMKLKNAAQMTAAIGLSTRVPTTVAMEFAESWKPLMKSKTNATATIATTYVTTALRVLERDALEDVRHVLTLVQRTLERVVQLLPLDDLQRIGILSIEQAPDREMVDRVALLLEGLDLPRLLDHQTALLHPDDGFLDPRGRSHQDRRQHLRRLARLLDPEHRHAPGSTVEQVDDIVQSRGQHVDVLTIERRDERLVDTRDDVVREHVRLVLDVLDRAYMFVEVLRLLEQLVRELRRRRHATRDLGEHREELLVTRNQSHEGTPG